MLSDNVCATFYMSLIVIKLLKIEINTYNNITYILLRKTSNKAYNKIMYCYSCCYVFHTILNLNHPIVSLNDHISTYLTPV